MTTKSSLLFFIISSVVMAPCISQAACTNNQQLQADSTFPKITGWVAYHTYMTYGDGSARLYLYDGPTKTSKQVNLPSWNISDPMNPNFSPNGKYIAFMGKQGGAWNNFVWEINTNTMPLNLTAALGGRNEDPKFSFDGKQIYFKHDFDIVIANLTYSNDKITGVSGWKYITNDRWNAEDSMPYPTPSGKYILYTIGSTALSIYRMNTQTGVRQLLTPTPADAHDYYPTVRDYSTYFFTRGVPVTHWDQLMMVQPNVSPTPIALALNDCNSNNSDPSPMDEDYLLFSSSRYDRPYGLMIGDISNGKVWRFSQSTVNVSDGSQKIGSSYTPYH